MPIFYDSLREHRVFLFYVPRRKVLQMFHAFLFEETVKGFWRKSQRNSKSSARDENVAIDIPGSGPKDVFEL